MKTLEQLQFENIYAGLSPEFYSRHKPTPLQNQFPIHFNETVSTLLGLDPGQGTRTDFTDWLTDGCSATGIDPLATCYSGHQFGNYIERLGDGRAILLGQIKTDGNLRWDLQLKGAGLTKYSGDGDGKAVLRSTIREYLCSAAMHGLGIPTTHALALFGSDEAVQREAIETAAMMVRVAPGHIRFGHFEYAFFQRSHDELQELADFVIRYYFPALQTSKQPYVDLLKAVVDSTAQLIAKWQSVGFCHGVMNTDNMSINGITIDYGPFSFLDCYDSGYISNQSDSVGRYAFKHQPRIGLFNLNCLAQALLPILDPDPGVAGQQATQALSKYECLFNKYYSALKRQKLGFVTETDVDEKLYDYLLVIMEMDKVDFTNCFRRLSEERSERRGISEMFQQSVLFDQWMTQYESRLSLEPCDEKGRSMAMKRVNPKYVLRTYLAENAIKMAQANHDFSEIEALMALLTRPFDEHPEKQAYALEPPKWARGLVVDCSS